MTVDEINNIENKANSDEFSGPLTPDVERLVLEIRNNIEEKEFIMWARENGVKSLERNGIKIEFWSPVFREEKKIDVMAILSAPITEDEIYGYDIPEHLRDSPDIETEVKK